MNSALATRTSADEVLDFNLTAEPWRIEKRKEQSSALSSPFSNNYKRLPQRFESASSTLPVAYEGMPVGDRDLLYADFRPLVQRLVRKYGDTPELRQDLVGEIYCLFCGIVDAYDPTRGVPFKPYVVHQLTSSVYTFTRKRWRQERREVRLEFREDTTIAGMPEATDPSDQWNYDITMRQMQAFLATAIAKLPLRQRQVVIWRYFEFRSFEEIAKALNVQVATARSSLRHGLNNIRRSFEKANLLLEL